MGLLSEIWSRGIDPTTDKRGKAKLKLGLSLTSSLLGLGLLSSRFLTLDLLNSLIHNNSFPSTCTPYIAFEYFYSR